MDSLDLTEPPRKDHMSLSRDSGLTLSDCQLFIPESPVGSEDSAVNATSSSYDKPLLKEDNKSYGKTYIRVYSGWEERMNYAANGGHHHSNNVEHIFREERNNVGYPNPNFQRQDWLRAQLKRTPRSKLDEHEHRKERYDEKDIYGRDYLRQDSMKENVENCKDIYRTSQLDISRELRTEYERTSQQEICKERVSDQDLSSDTSLSNDRYEFKKEHFGEFKKVNSEIYVNRDSPVSHNGSYHSNGDLYEFKKVKSEIYVNKESTRTERYESDSSIYGNRERVNELYGSSRERNDLYSFKQAEAIDLYGDEDEDEERIWPDTPPPLPPRLRHLPPVHMNLEDRHKVAGRSRSLPPPPPYRPPPQPRAPITTRHMGYGRSVVDDESYV